ncbi:hypothetical protein OG321_38725 [Streptomyces sp. NBC_00424]|uniref:hypothetical protein n=1 Tax=Streptomyces sp. NBC_00424 TaxID=2903648 RepID=UPI00224EDCE6|nr:hypothetical protein [Streptomyces sp. NBC_00424]MCX5078382.1 hypothetical protein [Streptomyces sp. NBC_00424]
MTTRQRLNAQVGALPNPLVAARAMTSPSTPDRIEDPVIARGQRIRTALGLVGVTWLLLAYPLSDGRQDFVLGKLEELLIGCAIVVVAGVVAVALCVLSARPPLRRVYARRVAGPLKALGTLPLGVGVAWLMLAALRGDIISMSDVGPHDITFGLFGGTLGTIFTGLLVGLLFVAAALVCVAVLVAALLFTLTAAYTGLNSCFRTGEVHELLPALLSPLLVWSLYAFQLFDGPDVAAPPVVLHTFSLAGPLSVSALSLWEIRRLRTRYGITFGSLLGR